MKTYTTTTFPGNNNIAESPTEKGFRDVRHFLSTMQCLAYASRHEADEAVSRVSNLAVGESTKVQRSWHPRHGAEFATVTRVA